MTPALLTQSVAAAAGVLLLTSVLQVWRRSAVGTTRLFAIQGAALAALVALLGIAEGDLEILAVAGAVLLLKGVLIPTALSHTLRRTVAYTLARPSVNPVAGLLGAAVLSIVAYVVSQPLVELHSTPVSRAVPVGFALVLIGLWLLMTRRHAVNQLIGFLVVDNGIATVAFLTAGGVPLIVELGVTLDVVLVVLILRVLTTRLHHARGDADVTSLQELHD